MAKRLIEELQIYQVELELQNEELRNAQQELEFSRDQYAELYHEAPVGYLSLDDRGHITEINKTACNLFGMQSAILIGQPFSNFVARIDLELYYGFINTLFNEISTGESTGREMRIRCAGNLQNYVELKGIIRLEPHSGRRICRIVLQDIENRKAMEEKQRLLQAAVEYSTDGISISDMRQLDNPIIYVSPKLEELSGYKAEELIGNNWRVLYEEEPDEEAKALMREALSLGRECRTYVRNIRKDGSPFFCEVTLYPLTDKKGVITHYVSVIRDVTEQRETDRAIQQAQRLD
ncbi:MAG: PAS domain S-box protein, partial [Chloroflexota bacterium]